MSVFFFFHQSKDLLRIEAVVNDGVYADVSWECETITMVRKFTFLYRNYVSLPFQVTKSIYIPVLDANDNAPVFMGLPYNVEVREVSLS